jgi:hypothetical protein
MATGDTKLKICNDSFIMLGTNIITSFTDGSNAAQIADRLYDDIKVSLLTMYPWSFSYKKTQLAKLETTPVNEWKYLYALPGDLISGPRALFNTSSVGGRPVTDWETISSNVQTNYSSVYIDYQYNISEDLIPQYFVQLLKYYLCWHFAEPITDQISKAQYWQGVATGSPGENGRGGFFRQATMADGQNQPPQVIEDFSLVSVRF